MTSSPFKCPVCASDKPFTGGNILWPDLIDGWELTMLEAQYINRQQAARCPVCKCNLRSAALAKALCIYRGHNGPLNTMKTIMSILEINVAGDLNPYLSEFAGHVLMEYPSIDMGNMTRIKDSSFDVVIHSDTLEHILNPTQALIECHRVLVPGGACILTVPIVVRRMSRSTLGRTPTYHGSPGVADPAMMVHTEFGTDTWEFLATAGFKVVSMVILEYPAGMAIIGVK